MRRALLAVAAVLAVAAGWLLLRRNGGTAAHEGAGEPSPAVEAAGAPSLARAPVRLPKAAVSAPATEAGVKESFRFHVVADANGQAVGDAEVIDLSGASLGRTAADGTLDVRVTAEALSPSTGVTVRARGFALKSESATPGEVCEVRLLPGTRIVGRVVLATTEAPVPMARVAAFDNFTSLRLGDDVVTGPDGRFAFEGAGANPVGAVVRVVGRVTASAIVWPETARAEIECVIRIEDGGTLEGVVTDGVGRPLASVPVTLLEPGARLDRGPSGPWAERIAASADRTITDGDGRYVIAGIPVDQSRIAVAEATPRLVGRSEPVVFTSVGERIRRDIRVAAPGSLHVVVEGVRAGDRQAMGVTLFTDSLEVRDAARDIAADGTWRFDGLTPGAYDVNFVRLGFPFVRRHATVLPGEVAEVRFAFRGSLVVEGQVVTEDGRPAARANLWWQGSTSTFVFADSEGRFRFEGLDATPGRLVAAASSEAKPAEPLARAVAEGVKPGGEPLRLVIGRGARVRVRIAGLSSTDAVATDVLSRLGRWSGPATVSDGGSVEVRVNALGVPLLLALGVRESAPLLLEVAPLSSGELRDLDSVRANPGREVRVYVRDEKDGPVAAATVVVTNFWGGEQTARTDEAGAGVLKFMPLRAFDVMVSAGTHPPHLVRAPAETTGPVVLRVDEGGTLEVRVIDREGAPAGQARVALLPGEADPYDPEPDAATLERKADDHGVLTERVQARAFRLHVRAATRDSETKYGPVEVRRGETTSVTVRLP